MKYKKTLIILFCVIFSIISIVTISAEDSRETLDVNQIGDIPIITDIIPYSKEHRPMVRMDRPKYITIHNTANEEYGADAKMHSNYLRYNDNDVSWHFTVDNEVIIQHLPLNEIGYHAGDGSNGPGNLYSIAIEICENSDGNYAQAEMNTVKLVAELLYEFDLDISNVVKHQHWIDKECPHNMINITKGSLGWKGFLDAVEKELNSIIIERTKVEEQNNPMNLRVGQSAKLSVYSTANNDNYKINKEGYKLELNKVDEDNHILLPAIENTYNYSSAIYLSSSDYSIDNPSQEYNDLLHDRSNTLEIIGDKIVDKDSRTNINTGIAQLTFTSDKGKASFYMYNYIKERPVITSNVEAFLKSGSAMNLLTDIKMAIEWKVEDEEIVEIKNGMIVGKKEGETIIHAKMGNVNISRTVNVRL